MIQEVTECVLVYRREDLEAWNRGDRSMAPSFYPPDLISLNPPSFGFAEILTLRHLHEVADEASEPPSCASPYPRPTPRRPGRTGSDYLCTKHHERGPTL